MDENVQFLKSRTGFLGHHVVKASKQGAENTAYLFVKVIFTESVSAGSLERSDSDTQHYGWSQHAALDAFTERTALKSNYEVS